MQAACHGATAIGATSFAAVRRRGREAFAAL
jgi:hypothetical protein